MSLYVSSHAFLTIGFGETFKTQAIIVIVLNLYGIICILSIELSQLSFHRVLFYCDINVIGYLMFLLPAAMAFSP